MPFKVSSPIEIQDQLIEDILVTAVEGGINYWCNKVRTITEGGEDWVLVTKEKDPVLAGCIDWLESIRKTGIRFYDMESGRVHPLKGDSVIQSGIQTMIAEYPKHFANLISETYDADTADAFLQCCLFGEIIYG